MKEWSKGILTIAQKKANGGDLEGAIALAQRIPANSPVQKEVKTTIAGWKKLQNQGPALEKAFEVALKRQDWQTAEDKTRALFRLNGDENESTIGRLRQRLAAERTARKQLQEARQRVQDGSRSPEALAAAITQATKVSPGTYAFVEAKSDLTNWSQSLLDIASERLTHSDLNGAIAAAKAVPFDVPPKPQVRDLVWFTRARSLAADPLPEGSLNEQLWQTWNGLIHVRQIDANSPFYQQGQALLPKLEQRIQVLTQLQFANSLASVGQIPSLQLAIRTAQTIPPDHSQRRLAQGLIARWRTDIQRVQDRPTLTKAEQLAASGKIPDLKAAIAQAKLIAPGRALRSEAQQSITGWNGQIQAIQDRPILNRAKALAKQRKLKAAIQTAEKYARTDRFTRKPRCRLKTGLPNFKLRKIVPF